MLCLSPTVRVDNYSCQGYQISVNLRVDIPYMVTVENRKFFRAASKFKQYFQFTLLILKLSSNWSYCKLHQELLKTPGLKAFRTSVTKLRCPLLWNLF